MNDTIIIILFLLLFTIVCITIQWSLCVNKLRKQKRQLENKNKTIMTMIANLSTILADSEDDDIIYSVYNTIISQEDNSINTLLHIGGANKSLNTSKLWRFIRKMNEDKVNFRITFLENDKRGGLLVTYKESKYELTRVISNTNKLCSEQT